MSDLEMRYGDRDEKSGHTASDGGDENLIDRLVDSIVQSEKFSVLIGKGAL